MSAYNLVADIGGTNARFALVRNHQIASSIYLATADFNNIEDAVSHVLQDCQQQGIQQTDIEQFSFALAGPVHRAEFALTNNHWRVNKDLINAVCGQPVYWLNDFAAQAWGIASLNKTDLLTVKTGDPVPQGNRLVIGPGTGLGVAGLIWSQGAWQPVIGEGGHVGFAPMTAFDIEILTVLLEQYQHVAAEVCLSGTGLPKLYQALGQVTGQHAPLQSPKDITQAAFSTTKKNALAQQTMQVFFRQLGHTTANAALTMGATGGVFLTGGLLPKFQTQLLASHFNQGFCINQSQNTYVHDIPVYLNLDENLGLKGASLALDSLG